jgi:hypothetical protein
VNCIVRQNREGINVTREPKSAMPAELEELMKKE